MQTANKVFWSESVRELKPYVPGEQLHIPGLIKLNTNENPYPPSPFVLTAIQQALTPDLRLYPDPNAEALTQAIAALHGVSAASVFVGNGSDEVLAHAFLALLKHPEPILFPDVSYSFYPVYCKLYDIDFDAVPVDADFQIRVEDYKRPNGGIVIPNPNAPTGRALGLHQLRTLLEANSTSVVLIDEAYVDFGAESAVPFIAEFPNLLVVQTLSKSRSLAGLRVGYAIGHPNLIEALNRVKGSFNSYPLDRLAIVGGVAAIADVGHFEKTRNAVIASRDALAAALTALNFIVVPSRANFLFVRHPTRDAATLQGELRTRNILVRHFPQPRIAQYLRISIGTDAECDALVSAFIEIFRDA